MPKKTPKFHCKSAAQKNAIRKSYAIKAKQKPLRNDGAVREQNPDKVKREFPKDFPFWARLRISKNRTTLVIDEERGIDKKTRKEADLYVHREATHTKGHGEPIIPNPDKDDPEPMYLRSPRKLPKKLFVPHNKDLDMPEELKRRYEKNNHKDNTDKKEQ